ncbi:MAG: hypothetical protein M1294_08805 [Firmicutes bacterium]|uniref:Uncharacterized protein n=1 Tax=Sulfobacillus benefaciens TaxID=453960 RepID=A0A2T2WHV8_9FIRM|nr:hypothetical protein [Bacillota bacterium]PSR21831.1 MAG: hypothetical protein C7B43_21065 [Sulfobacillus benefaciens]HBQ96608.1 hypothetical protein [Sulfobacillus sp.]
MPNYAEMQSIVVKVLTGHAPAEDLRELVRDQDFSEVVVATSRIVAKRRWRLRVSAPYTHMALTRLGLEKIIIDEYMAAAAPPCDAISLFKEAPDTLGFIRYAQTRIRPGDLLQNVLEFEAAKTQLSIHEVAVRPRDQPDGYSNKFESWNPVLAKTATVQKFTADPTVVCAALKQEKDVLPSLPQATLLIAITHGRFRVYQLEESIALALHHCDGTVSAETLVGSNERLRLVFQHLTAHGILE